MTQDLLERTNKTSLTYGVEAAPRNSSFSVQVPDRSMIGYFPARDGSASVAWTDATSTHGYGLNSNASFVLSLRSSFDIRSSVAVRFQQLRREGLIAGDLTIARRLAEILSATTLPGGATPQLGPTPDGCLEIQWLAGGLLASALIDADGSLSFYAEDDNGREVVDLDFPEFEPLEEGRISEFVAFLGAIKNRIRFQL